MSIEICDICGEGCSNSVIDTSSQILEENGHACPMKELLPRRPKKTSDAPATVLNDSYSASLALIASYSPLNARLNVLLSPVSYRTAEVLELLHRSHGK